ncbi:MAG: hypothetical protein H6Q24_361, partial [Bacteroidetes bacterium]|nr:hypothetical protein [Bacteroidota bacterium]
MKLFFTYSGRIQEDHKKNKCEIQLMQFTFPGYIN